MKLRKTAWVLLMLAGLMACSRSDGPEAPTAPMASAAQVESVFGQTPWLRERLPADTIVYARLPNLWRALLGPAGKQADRMFQSQAWIDAVNQIRTDLGKNALTGEAAVPATGLLYRMRSPVEVAVIAAGRMASPAANVYATVGLDYPDAATLATALGALVGQSIAFDAEGYATGPADGAPVFLHFDAASGRLSLLGGMYANLDSLKTMRKQIAEAKVEARPELALEREIDLDGQGMVLWADIEALRPVLGGALTPGDEVQAAILAATRRVAVGWGSLDGHGRASLRAEVSGAPWSPFLPSEPRKIDLKASGTPTMVVAFALPSKAEIEAMIAKLSVEEPELQTRWADSSAEFERAAGVQPLDLLQPFGPEAVVWADDAGEIMGLRLRDRAAFAALKDKLAQSLKLPFQSTEVPGGTVHSVRFPSVVELARQFGEQTPPNDEAARYLEAYGRIGTHLYWIEAGDWLLLSGVPQPLMDRLTLGAETPLGVGTPVPLLHLSGRVRDAERWIYYSWLSLLPSLSDLAQTKLDLTRLPTARQLGLARETPVSFAFDLSASRVVLQMDYAAHPLEALGGGQGAIVAVAVMAAIAIPAYQDYTVRARLSEAMIATAPLKTAIAEYYAAHGTLPTEAAELGLELPITVGAELASIELDHGAVVIRFGTAVSQLTGTYLYLLPAGDDSTISSWECGVNGALADHLLVSMNESTPPTDVPARYLPTQCR